MTQEGLLCLQRPVADLCRCLASSLAHIPQRARATESGNRLHKGSQPFRGDQVREGLLPEAAQDGRAVVARADVAQRVEGVVGTVRARSSESEMQVRVRVVVNEAGLDGDRARDREGKLGRDRVSHP